MVHLFFIFSTGYSGAGHISVKWASCLLIGCPVVYATCIGSDLLLAWNRAHQSSPLPLKMVGTGEPPLGSLAGALRPLPSSYANRNSDDNACFRKLWYPPVAMERCQQDLIVRGTIGYRWKKNVEGHWPFPYYIQSILIILRILLCSVDERDLLYVKKSPSVCYIYSRPTLVVSTCFISCQYLVRAY